MNRFWKLKPQNANLPIDAKANLQHISIGVCGILVVLVYVWFISVSQWTNWREGSNYYDQLAEGFDSGQLSVITKADPALLAMQHPYDYNSRSNIPYMWDMSLYKGKYYLYWGPAPALILALIKPIYNSEIGDQYITFMFLVGLLIFNILILISIHRDFFKSLPTWTVLISILVAGLVTPIPWIAHQPLIYEAAITGGQFFLIGGVYWVYIALTKSPVSKWNLFLAGLFWALAFGSRVVLAFPIAFLLFLTWLGITRIHFNKPESVRAILLSSIAIGIPIILAVVAYGWYNWARFGSIFEFGFRYQLNKDNLISNYNLTFSTAYVHSNFHNYILMPFQTASTFPFFKAAAGSDSLIADSQSAIYRARNITGLLYNFPFALFAIVPIVAVLLSFIGIKLSQYPLNKFEVSIKSLAIGFAGAALLGFLPTLFYFRVAMRFLFDFVPALTLLTILGFWLAYYFSRAKPVARRLVSAAALGLAIFSIVVNILFSISWH